MYNEGDSGAAIAVDSLGDAYVAGLTDSNDLPITTGAFQVANAGFGNQQPNAFVAKLDPSGTALLYSTYMGGSGRAGGGPETGGGDTGTAIAVDTIGNAYVAGAAASPNFPVTAGVFQGENKAPAMSSLGNAFIAKLTLTSARTATTTTAITADYNPQSVRTAVTFHAKVKPSSGTGLPTGIVGFSVDAGAGPAVTLDNAGQAAYSTSSLSAGAHSIAATYSGDSNYTSSSISLTETISPSSTPAARQASSTACCL